MYCMKCGAELIDGAQFCSKCGTSVEVRERNEVQVSETVTYSTKKKMSMGVVICSAILSMICVLMSGILFGTRPGHYIPYRPILIITLGIMIVLFVSCILLRKTVLISIIPFLAFVILDFLTIQQTFEISNIPGIASGGLIMSSIRIALPVAAVAFAVAVLVNGTAGKMCSVISVVCLAISIFSFLSNCIKYTSKIPFMGIASPRIFIYMRISFYICYIVISIAVLMAKSGKNIG
ncbi:MAG: zinc-ribbon domain-containing protein [Lachnospiraceae bacterium]|nr:zinc-ribbon domain-containing protein [Lachnospiraceae bacterium]